MFSTDGFQAWGKENAVLFAAVMTKIEGRKEDDLLRTYGFRGFPSMAILDASGEALTKNVGRDVFSMATATAAAMVHSKLAPKVEAGEEVDAAAWFMARLGMGELELDAAREEIEKVELSDAQRKSADTQMFVMEFTAVVSDRETGGEEKADAVYAFHKAGKSLPDGSSLSVPFNSLLVEGAKKAGDSAAFFVAYPSVRDQLEERSDYLQTLAPKYEDNKEMAERLKQAIAQVTEQLEELEAAAARLKKKG